MVGRAFYLAGFEEAENSPRRDVFYLKADSVFERITVKAPDVHIGYHWRARCQAQMDPGSLKGLAKPFYQKSMEILEASPRKGNQESDYLESLKYFGAYYTLVEEDIQLACEYWRKILVLDPEDASMQAAMGFLNCN